MARRSESGARSALRARLEARRPEIEEAALSRANVIAVPREASGPIYAEGLRASVTAALDYGLEAIERDAGSTPPVPVGLLAQARLAARNGVTLDTVLRRYFAGYGLFTDLLVDEAVGMGLEGAGLKRLLSSQATLFDRLVAAVSEEHSREAGLRPTTSEQRRVERVERLLSGERIDTSSFGYDFEGHHVGVVASGEEAPDAIRRIAGLAGGNTLVVRRDETTWVWLGARRKLDHLDLGGLGSQLPANVFLAFGEPSHGMGGWRLTHRQAAAALQVGLRRGQRTVRYRDVALLASALGDDLLSTSLRQMYLEPLQAGRDGGESLRQTLQTYFATERNITSVAAALGVSRNTVRSRLREVEVRIGRSLGSLTTDFHVALLLDGADGHPAQLDQISSEIESL